MKIAFALTALAALVHLGTAQVTVRGLKKNEDKKDKAKDDDDDDDDFDETAEPLIEELTVDNGATIRIYENDPGAIVVLSTLPAGVEVDPVEEYQKEKKDKKKDVGEFYEQLTGKKPTGQLKKALRRHQKNKDKTEERDEWDEPPEDEEDGGSMEKDEEGPAGRRELCLNCAHPVGSDDWWVNTACRFSTSIDWCSCLTSRTGNAWKQVRSDDFYQKVYPYRGTVYHKIQYWKCTKRWIFWPFSYTWDCAWKHLNSDWVYRGEISSLWGTSGGSWTYKGSLTNAGGDGWHLSWYDVADSSIGCSHGGLGGCYVCPNVI